MEPPAPPDESDCCNSGCNPCILDVYEAQLKKFKEFNQKLVNTRNCISTTSYTKFTLTERKQVSPDVFLLKFVYGDNKKHVPDCFQYSPGQYLLVRAKDYAGEFTRAYTPIPVDGEGFLGFTIMIRIYQIGRMSKLLNKLQIGHKTSWRGPYGDFELSYKYRYLLFVAQGTGIAPLFAIIHRIVHDEECECFVKLFFCCRNSEDILLREELYKLREFWNFSYEIFLSNCDNVVRKYNETVHERKLSEFDLQEYVGDKLGQVRVMICGSETFGTNLGNKITELGIQSEHIYLF